MDKPIDDLIDRAYSRSDLAATMLSVLNDPLAKRWPKALRKELRTFILTVRLLETLSTTGIDYSHSPMTSFGHNPGCVKTLDLIARDSWWPRISRDVEEYGKACELCARTKPS